MLKNCIICGNIFRIKPSHYDRRTTCGNKLCKSVNMSMRLKGKKKSEEHRSKLISILIENGAERGRKISKALKGKRKTDIHKKNLSKAHKNKKLTEIHKHRIGESNKGKKNSEKQKEAARTTLKKIWKKKGHIIARKISETKIKNGSMIGIKNPNWRGGISFKPYPISFNRTLKRSIKDRDGHTCQNPNCKRQNKYLHVHHIDYDKQNGCPLNLITLCRPCHTQTNYRREHWTSFYSQITKQKDLMAA